MVCGTCMVCATRCVAPVSAWTSGTSSPARASSRSANRPPVAPHEQGVLVAHGIRVERVLIPGKTAPAVRPPRRRAMSESTVDIPRIISVDDHVVEPPDLWTTRLPSQYQDKGPRVVRDRAKFSFTGGDPSLPNGVVDRGLGGLCVL